MRITVKVKASARHTLVEKVEDGYYRVAVKEPAKQGRANEAVIAALADHFLVQKQNISIIIGKTAKEKLIEIKHYE